MQDKYTSLAPDTVFCDCCSYVKHSVDLPDGRISVVLESIQEFNFLSRYPSEGQTDEMRESHVAALYLVACRGGHLVQHRNLHRRFICQHSTSTLACLGFAYAITKLR